MDMDLLVYMWLEKMASAKCRGIYDARIESFLTHLTRWLLGTVDRGSVVRACD